MTIYFGGNEYDEIHIAGREHTKLQFGGNDYHSKTRPDTAGVLSVSASRRSRGAQIDYSITDVDGIRSISSVIMRADDGTVSDVTSQISRSNANTFTGDSTRSNNKWRVASITITYVDNRSGASHTLTRNWSI